MLRKCERLQLARSQKRLAWKAVAQPHLLMALLSQRHRDWVSLLNLPPQIAKYLRKSLHCSCHSYTLKMRTSSDSSQPERASLESCCSGSSAHGTARTEARRLGLMACLATSDFKRIVGRPCQVYFAALL